MNSLQKNERKRNYSFTKALPSLQGPILSTWRPEEWALLKLLKLISWLFSKEIYRGPLVWAYSPAKRGWGWVTGDSWTKISGSKNHIPLNSRVLWKCLTGVRTNVCTPSSSRKSSSFIVLCILWFSTSGKTTCKKRDNGPKMESPVLSPHHQTKAQYLFQPLRGM